MKNRNGQVLPYMLIMSIILILSWAMMLNIAKILRDKMILQNTVDNAAISMANLQARTLNLLGQTNYLMATVLSTAGYPESLTFDILLEKFVGKEKRKMVENWFPVIPRLYVPSFSTDKICGSMILGPFCDYKCGGINTKYSGVKYLRETIKEIQAFQDFLIGKYVVEYGLLLKQFSTKDMKVIVMPSRFAKNITDFNFGNFSLKDINPQTWLGIKRNSKKIKYYKTKNYCFKVGVVHAHFVKPEDYATDNYSWYIQDENFYDKKFVAAGWKTLNKGYPLFKGVFDISMPKLLAVSAAGVYNVEGPMFPEKETVYTGVNIIVAALADLKILAQQYKMLKALEIGVLAIPLIGEELSAIIYGLKADMVAAAGYNFYQAQSDKQTPMYKYNEAKLGGWDAHLVPL